MDESGRAILEAIARSAHGFVIVGQPESGKTTLLNALLLLVPADSMTSVERAGELRLPDGAKRLVPIWPGQPKDEAQAVSFGGQIRAALEETPQILLLDEVRADEPESIAPLLQDDADFRQIWSFRGAVDPKRVRSALGMLARRAMPAQPEAAVKQLYQRLPFVITVRRRRGVLQLRGIAEWQDRGGEYADYVLLWEAEGDQFQRRGNKPSRTLELPDDFWA
jgi:energy-coupling factor transporter ATP-binding protein EcfA2